MEGLTDSLSHFVPTDGSLLTSGVKRERKVKVVREDGDIIGTPKQVVKTTERLPNRKLLILLCCLMFLRAAERATEERKRIVSLINDRLT